MGHAYACLRVFRSLGPSSRRQAPLLPSVLLRWHLHREASPDHPMPWSPSLPVSASAFSSSRSQIILHPTTPFMYLLSLGCPPTRRPAQGGGLWIALRLIAGPGCSISIYQMNMRASWAEVGKTHTPERQVLHLSVRTFPGLSSHTPKKGVPGDNV